MEVAATDAGSLLKPAFVIIATEFTLDSKTASREDIGVIASGVTDDFQAIKAKVERSDDEGVLRVGVELYVTQVLYLAEVFWSYLDAVRAGVDAFFQRCLPEVDTSKISAVAGVSAVEKMESALKAGSKSAVAVAGAFGQVHEAVGFVYTETGSGTAFCVHSTSTSSLYLTNAHVVEDDGQVMLYRQHPHFDKQSAKVVVKGDSSAVDLALLESPVGKLQILTFANSAFACDIPIAVAGYPRVQLLAANLLGEIDLAIHVGTVTCVTHDGKAVMHDALTRPGSSGGPVFDPASGVVYGVTESGWESEEEGVAIGAAVASLANVTAVVVPLSSKEPRFLQPWHHRIDGGKYPKIDTCGSKMILWLMFALRASIASAPSRIT